VQEEKCRGAGRNCPKVFTRNIAPDKDCFSLHPNKMTFCTPSFSEKTILLHLKILPDYSFMKYF